MDVVCIHNISDDVVSFFYEINSWRICYGVVDGFFVSNFAGKTSFAVVNFIMPFLMIVATVGFMFGTGGTAIVAKTFGEGEDT